MDCTLLNPHASTAARESLHSSSVRYKIQGSTTAQLPAAFLHKPSETGLPLCGATGTLLPLSRIHCPISVPKPKAWALQRANRGRCKLRCGAVLLLSLVGG